VEHWYSYLYCYGVGGLIFATGLFLGLKNRVLKLERQRDRMILFALLGAYFYYAVVHGVWNYLAIASR